MHPVKFKPVAMPRIWGGHRLKETFSVSTAEPIGEYWVVSGHPNGMSVVVDGPHAGKTLSDLTSTYPELYLGASPQPRFPLLIKFLEAEADLSVQIHPDDDYAQAHEGDFGKTEAWYILDAQVDGQVNYGHTFATREAYETAVKQGTVREFLAYKPVQKGDLVFVPARTLHALLAGTVVLEIQQTSDVTYRVYDWDRLGDDGNPRALHTDKAADVLTYHHEHPMVNRTVIMDTEDISHDRLVSCPYFTIESLQHRSAVELQPGHKGNPDVLVVLSGEGTLKSGDSTQAMKLKAGDAVLVPANVPSYTVEPTDGQMTVIRTFY